jgi:hypothetical protein
MLIAKNSAMSNPKNTPGTAATQDTAATPGTAATPAAPRRRSLTEFAVRNYQFTLIVFIMLAAIGVNSLLTMPRGEDPDFEAPSFAAIVIYPGTSPKDMEELVVNPMEKRLNAMDDIKRIRSTIDDGLAVIQIEFKYETDPDKKYEDVIREIDAVRGELPRDILPIDIQRFTPSDVNILQVALVSETAPYKDLQEWSRKLKDRLGLPAPRGPRRPQPRKAGPEQDPAEYRPPGHPTGERQHSRRQRGHGHAEIQHQNERRL